MSIALAFPFTTAEFKLWIHPAAAAAATTSSTSTLHLVQGCVGASPPRDINPSSRCYLTTNFVSSAQLASQELLCLRPLTEEREQGLIHPSVSTWLPQPYPDLSCQKITLSPLLPARHTLCRGRGEEGASSVALTTCLSTSLAKP